MADTSFDYAKWLKETNVNFQPLHDWANLWLEVQYSLKNIKEKDMLTDMDKLVLDSMIQNDETIETMCIIFSAKFSACTQESATRYLNYKKLRTEIEKYVNEED